MYSKSERPPYPSSWEKIVSVVVAVLIFLVVAWLVIRNQPFRDPNLVVILRIILSVAVAVLGATIPGFLRFDWKAKGLVIRSGGALSLFIISYIWSPAVIQAPVRPPPPPLTSYEISTLRAQGFNFAVKIRGGGGYGPGAASVFKSEIEPIANKIWADQRYEQQAPHESALIFRLYAATLLIERPVDDNIMKVIKNALPWVRKAVVLDDKAGDHGELKRAVSFLDQVAQGKFKNVKLSVMLKHQFRVAMPGAKPAEIEKHVQSMVQLMKKLVKPTAGGSSPKEDLNYLVRYKLGDFSVGQVMEVMRIDFKGRFPNVDVGGQPIFTPMPNSNTLVRFIFDNGAKKLLYEWEVNKSKGLIIPKNDATRELMNLQISK